MNYTLHLTRRATLYVLFTGLVSLALLLSALRLWLLPRAGEYRALLETRIATQVGYPVRINRFSASLDGFQPELALYGVEILDRNGQSTLRFERMHVGLDSWRSLVSMEPVIGRLEIRGVQLALRRREDGSYGILGLDSGEGAPTWLLADGRYELLDCKLDYQDLYSGSPLLKLGKADLRLDNRGNRHRLDLQIKKLGEFGQSLRVNLDAEGEATRLDNWHGLVYLEVEGFDLSRFSAVAPVSAYQLQLGKVDARIWLQWQHGPQRLIGDFALANPKFAVRRGSGSVMTFAPRRLSSRFDWQDSDRGWRLDLADLELDIGATPSPAARIAVAVKNTDAGGMADLRGFASYLNLADLRGALLLLEGAPIEALQALAPRGTLHDLKFYFSPNAPTGERLGLCGWFQGFGMDAWNEVPGLSGLGGTLCGSGGAGHAEVFSRSGQVYPARLGLRRPVPLAEASATIDWRQGETDWELDVASFSLLNREIHARGGFRLVLDKSGVHSPFLDLHARLEGPDFASARYYLPYDMIPITSAWLEKSLLKGRARESVLLFHGFLGDFPFIGQQGVFQAEVEAEGVELRFHPDWPPLTQTDVRLWFENAALDIQSRRGRVGEGEIVEASAAISDLQHPYWLGVQGKVRAGVVESLDYLSHSPIRDIPDRLNKFVRPQGKAEIDLRLTVPLDSSKGETGVEGSVKFQDATLEIKDAGIAFSKIEGPLQFNRSGLRTEGISARFLGAPVKIAIDQERDDIQIAVQGHVEQAALRKQLPSQWWERARGGADYRLLAHLPKSLDARGTPARLELQSDLHGLSLDLPPPFVKTETEARVLRLSTSLREEGEIPLEIDYGPEARARLRFMVDKDGRRLAGGEFALGTELQPPDGADFVLSVKQSELDLATWRDWLKQARSSELGRISPSLRCIRLDVGNLRWKERNLGTWSLDLAQSGDVWTGRIGGDVLRGTLRLAADRIGLELDTLAIPNSIPTWLGGLDSDKSTPADFDPATLPNLSLNAGHVLWKKEDLGSLHLQSDRHAHGAILRALTLKGEGHALELEGGWTRDSGQGVATRLRGNIHMDDLGKFLGHFGYSGQLRDTRSDVTLNLNWPGAPHELQRATVAGEVDMKLGKGAMLEIEPGLGRVLGMFSLDTIWRRLNFDFSDLFSKGLAFDAILGTFHLGEGQARTKGFLIDAVSAKILITGRAGLVTRDLDQTVIVIPHTSVALPVAGVLAGGPAVGAAVLLAQQLVGDKVDSITATQYGVTGSWDQPHIVKIHNNLPLDMLDRAWSGVKDLSGFSNQEKQQGK